MENNISSNAPLFAMEFINPTEVIEKMEINPGMKIADFGCGTGYFTFPLAKKVDTNGVVYALDILKEKVEAIDSQAKLEGFTNIIAKRVNLEMMGGSKLSDESVDWVLLVNMLFQNQNKQLVIEEAKRVLKQEGHILVIEWNPEDVSMGPERQLRISKDEMAKLASQNGLTINGEIEISNFHYGLILSKL